MDVKDIEVVIRQCQFCEYWDINNGCVEPNASDENPIDDCGCFVGIGASKYSTIKGRRQALDGV